MKPETYQMEESKILVEKSFWSVKFKALIFCPFRGEVLDGTRVGCAYASSLRVGPSRASFQRQYALLSKLITTVEDGKTLPI